jgi:BirA family biotin operon repressor/biotin-[acetyl-CoA-carboxylase] ligase
MSSIKTACSIKWPNDIYWAGRKLCGILLENHPARANTLVIGFGLNVTTPSFPEELRNIATSLFIETGKRFSRSELLRNILTDFRRNLDLPVAKAHQLYDRRLFGTGHGAEVDGHRGVYEGVGIDGTLRLRTTRDVIHVITGHLRFTDTPGENHAR